MTAPSAVRRGSAAAAIALGIAAFLLINWLGYRHWARGDWTKARIYSISETTRKVVSGLKAPVRITAVMTSRARLFQPVSELLNRYRALSPKIEVEIVDPERNPARAEALVREFGIRQNTVIFRSGDKKKYVEEDKLADFDFAGAGMGGGAPEIKAFKGEQAFTSAILEVTENKQAKVYVTSGHGESTLDSSERGRGFSEAKQLLERDNLTVAPWDSLGKGDVPADASVVVVAGPRTAFLEPETAALEKYLAGGGRALVLIDPVLPAPGAPPADLGLGSLLSTYGLKTVNDIVIDPANAVPLVGPETVIANHFGTHPVVRPLSEQNIPVLFPIARSLSKEDASAAKTPATTSATMLVETTPDGWGETGLTELDAVAKDAKDVPGPVTIAMAVGPADEKRGEKKDEKKDEKKEEKTPRLVVVGNSRFAANGSLGNAGNANLFLNAIHWLAGEEKLVGIAAKTPEQASLSLTRSQVNRIGIFAVAGMPILAVILGVWVWYRRRD